MSAGSRSSADAGMPCLPAVEAGQRVGLRLRARDLDDRHGALAATGRRRSACRSTASCGRRQVGGAPGVDPGHSVGRPAFGSPARDRGGPRRRRPRVAARHRRRDPRSRVGASLSGRLDAWRLARLLGVVAAATARRPVPPASSRADSSSSASSEPTASSMPAPGSPSRARSASGHRQQREVAELGVGHLVPGQRRRDASVGRRAHRVGRGDGAVLGVLVVVEEDAVALLLPPLAGRDRRRSPLDVAGQGERRAADLRIGPARLDAHVDVDAARAGRLGPADQPDRLERLTR